MIARRLLTLCACLCLASILAAARPAAARPADPGQTVLARTYDQALRAIHAKNFQSARSLALKLIHSPQWKHGDVAYAGAIRGLADELRAARQGKLADEIIQAGEKAHKATGDAQKALHGRMVSRTAPTNRFFFRKGFRARAIFSAAHDLARIRAGEQVSILKIMDPSEHQVVFFKGLDASVWAPLYDSQRSAIFKALGISPERLDAVADNLMDNYDSLQQKKECLALLSAIGSCPGQQISDGTRRKLLTFLATHLRQDRDVHLRREALLALALQDALTKSTVNQVVDFYGSSTNVWECFPIVQFFEYHHHRLAELHMLGELKSRFSTPDMREGLYTPYILETL